MRANDFAMIDHLWRTWSPGLELDDARRRELHACLAQSLPGPLAYYRAMVRPLAKFRERARRLAAPLTVPILQLHGADDGCILPPDDSDARRFTHRELAVLPGRGHFLHLETPAQIATRISSWLA